MNYFRHNFARFDERLFVNFLKIFSDFVGIVAMNFTEYGNNYSLFTGQHRQADHRESAKRNQSFCEYQTIADR